MRKLTQGAVSVVLTIGVLSGCSSAADKDGDGTRESTAPAELAAKNEKAEKAEKNTGRPDAKKVTRIGPAGSACELPVSFELAKAWKPSGLSAEDGKLLAELTGHTAFRGSCELDAKPAGNIGFMRVWTTDRAGSSARGALETYMAEEKHVTDRKISDVKAGDLAAAEVVYTQKSALTDEPREQRALAVKTPKGVTLVHLGGLDSQEHKEMLPAYELAKKTMTLTS
ncbi:lipoprotein [Streptomyces sp. URMC 124]|uniref:lipoprotein n=1 Tax=Streptomyces sp. URMC 124 TaxID=3423405 RepID=UPI003F1E1D41